MNRLAKACLFYFCLNAAFLVPISSLSLSKTRKHESLKEQYASSKTLTDVLRDTPCSTKGAADPADVGMLKQFYMSTGGSDWINQQGWLKGDPCKDEWFGVCCDDSGKVLEINLPKNQLVGELPGFFTGLTAVRIPYNYIGGHIPLNLFLSSSIEIIDLEHNQFEGAIPSKLDMPELRNLTLSKNKLGGLLPTQWNVPNLQVLSLASNMFEGSLPSSLGGLTKLQVLDLSANSLSGSLPTEYGGLVSLEKLWLFENQFDSPEIPTSWLEMRSIRNFQMNSLNGQIPKSLGSKWLDLEVLILVNGNLVGSIPTSVCNLKKLQYLHVFYNNVSGSIPDCLCATKDSALTSIDLSNNLLTGSIPDCIGNLQNLRYIYLSNNGITGSLPDSLRELETLYSLDVNTNRLSGSIPSSLVSLRGSLNQFDLSTNYFSSIENGLEPLFDEMNKKSCNVYGNPFSCPIPSYITSCGNPRCSTCNTGRNHTSCSICVKTEFCSIVEFLIFHLYFQEGETKKNGDEQKAEDNTFEALEKDFQEVLLELMGDKSLEKFRVEYEKLHKALKKSHESEKRLMHKCRELNAEIVANASKVTTALKLSQEDKDMIASLKQEIDRLWKMLNKAHENEARATSTIEQLKLEISNLAGLVEKGAGLDFSPDENIQDLSKQKEELLRERDEQLDQIMDLKKSLDESNQRQKDTEEERVKIELTVLELRNEITVKTQEMERENRRKAKLEKDLDTAKAESDAKTQEVKNKQLQLQKAEEECRKVEQVLRETKAMYDNCVKQNDSLSTMLNRKKEEYEQQMLRNEDLAGKNSEQIAEIQRRDEEINGLKQEIVRINKLREGIQRKLRGVEEQKADIESKRESLKQQMTSLERELELARKQADTDKKMYEDLVRERDILSKDLRKSEGSFERLEHLVKIREQSIKTLQHEIANFKEEAKKQRNLLCQLERERDRYGKDATDATQKCLTQMEEVKRKEMELLQIKKNLAERENKLKQQQTLYEAVCGDRNLYSKQLIEAKDEITEMKRKLKILSHQIDQLKEEIASKDSALVKVNVDLIHVEREKDSLSSELSGRKQELEATKSLLESQRAEERKLRKILSEASSEQARQKKELEKVINERDILGTQLIRRNDELVLLYEKIKIQQSTLSKGEAQYSSRLEDIRILKLEIRKLRRERGLLSKSVSNVDELKRELYHSQRELLRERTRCKALEEELENPMNIHRWRKLEGSDPSTFEMIQKIHTLQRRLIQKTEEVVEKELLIQEKEKLYVELKQILQRQPGPEVAEQLQIYQQTLKDKTKQMKSMASELNMYESQVADHKMDIERLSRELQEVKKKYYLQKKKEQLTRERERVATQGLGPPIIPQSKQDMPRFTGGGFNLKQTHKMIS